METSSFVLFLVLMPVVLGAWKSSLEERAAARNLRRGLHYHSKRHMLPENQEEKKKPTPTPKVRHIRKKPSGHLAPLDDDDMDNDEVVSVAIGPPSVRPKYEKGWKSHPVKRHNTTRTSHNTARTSNNNNNNNSNFNNNAVNFVRDVLTQLGREFLSNQVNENFVFGQYVGNAMKNLTSEVKLKMQHDILDIIVKYQKNRGDATTASTTELNELKQKEDDRGVQVKDIKIDRKLNVISNNDTEEGWPDFSNLAKIVG